MGKACTTMPKNYFLNDNIALNWAEEKFLEILINYEVSNMVKKVYSQKWVRTMSTWRRIDFVLVIKDDPMDMKGLFIEIDGEIHNHPRIHQEDIIREWELFTVDFPIFRIDTFDVFNRPEAVADYVVSKIELMKGA